MSEKKQPICRECQILFKTWSELAKHIVENQETHPRQSVMFAYHVLSDVDNVKEHKARMPMSDELKQAVKECVRELSGRTEIVRAVCPDCRKVFEKKLEVEYINGSPWRNSLGTFITMCDKCKFNYRTTKIKRENPELVSEEL